MAIGDFVKQKRKELKMTMEELAALCGTSKQVINLLEHGVTRVPSEKVMQGLSAALNVSKADIITYVYNEE